MHSSLYRHSICNFFFNLFLSLTFSIPHPEKLLFQESHTYHQPFKKTLRAIQNQKKCQDTQRSSLSMQTKPPEFVRSRINKTIKPLPCLLGDSLAFRREQNQFPLGQVSGWSAEGEAGSKFSSLNQNRCKLCQEILYSQGSRNWTRKSFLFYLLIWWSVVSPRTV